ncbi:MAG: hypothetical protein HFI59_15525 [Lachnospiraceae bacterium]|jgi:hypothetical protein|nr:hypothetical protein [Lachnospiraceae bacterium]
MEKDRKIIVGFKTIILGLCLYVIELMYLPVFGALQKAQVSGDGFYSDFWKYTEKQPYPIIFILTGIIVVLGIAFVVLGYREKRK